MKEMCNAKKYGTCMVLLQDCEHGNFYLYHMIINSQLNHDNLTRCYIILDTGMVWYDMICHSVTDHVMALYDMVPGTCMVFKLLV